MSTHSNDPSARSRVGVRITRTLISLTLLVPLFALNGCSTASSLGLPVGSGPYKLLSVASKIRASTGHPEDVPHEMSKVVQTPHQVEPGDVLVVEATDFDSPVRFPSDQTVQADGTIDLGQYGRAQVAGMTLEEIKHNAQTRVAAHHDSRRGDIAQTAFDDRGRVPATLDTSISVRLISNESSVIYVLGEVNAPGSYPLAGRETVLDSIIAAGGLTDQANEHKIILTRPANPNQPRQILPICFQQIVQLGDTSTNFQVQPGDRIYVPSLTILEDIRQSFQIKEKSCPHCKDFGRE